VQRDDDGRCRQRFAIVLHHFLDEPPVSERVTDLPLQLLASITGSVLAGLDRPQARLDLFIRGEGIAALGSGSEHSAQIFHEVLTQHRLVEETEVEGAPVAHRGASCNDRRERAQELSRKSMNVRQVRHAVE